MSVTSYTEDRHALSPSVEPSGLLRVNASPGFGRRVLAPAVSAFACRYPNAEVLLRLSERPLDLIDAAFDVGIRIGQPDTDGSRLAPHYLCANRRLLCAAPTYLKQRGMPLTLDDLCRHQAILLDEDGEPGDLWRLRRGDLEQTVKVHGSLRTNDGEVAVRWALDGLGILLRSEWDIGTDLKAGRLVVLVPQWSMPADIWALVPRDRSASTDIQVFLDFLADWLTPSSH